MKIKDLINKSDNIQMAIESNELLIENYGFTVLQPIVNYLREEKRTVSNQLSTITHDIEVQTEEVNRVSKIY